MPKKDTVWCILSNESTLFSVKIDLNKTVDDMKEKIHEKRNKTLAKFDAAQLTLYRVEIPGVTTLSDDVLATIIQQKLSEPLIELNVMRQLVEVGVNQDTLIIAKAPTTATHPPIPDWASRIARIDGKLSVAASGVAK